MHPGWKQQSPLHRSGSLTRQRERTNSLRNDGSKRLVISWGRPFRNKSDFGMAFQLTDAHCFPPGSQVHRMDSRNSEKWSHQNAPHRKTSARPSDEWDMWISWFHGFTTSSVGFVLCVTVEKLTIYHNQWHEYERFGVNKRNSGKSKEWNWYELTHILSAWPGVLFRFVPSWARGIQ